MMRHGFKIDLGGDFLADPLRVEAAAVRAEADGYHGVLVAETRHDPFLGLSLAARGTSRIELRSAIAVAFARNPMTTAVLANDLQLISGGRFRLGLGSQVRQHIERRFGMPWSRPAARMREYISAIRAIWASWATGERLDFEGELYHHTLMTPFFDPGPNPHGNPPILLAGVGERMTEVAGQVADGFLCHSLTTGRYLKEVTLPALRRGRAEGGAALDGFSLSLPALVVVGRSREEQDSAAAATRRQIAFYGRRRPTARYWICTGGPPCTNA
jgi:probable F420-dependent oxidoreductase